MINIAKKEKSAQTGRHKCGAALVCPSPLHYRSPPMAIVSNKEWHELPGPAAAAKLVQLRNELREKNLHDTEEPPLENSAEPASAELRNTRTSDGTYNDLTCP